MTASKAEYESAALLLKEVWYAVEHLNETERTIDWTAIQEVADQISPSTSELFKVNAARALWTGQEVAGGSYIDALNYLDARNWELFILALRTRRGISEPIHDQDVQDAIGRAEEAASGGAL